MTLYRGLVEKAFANDRAQLDGQVYFEQFLESWRGEVARFRTRTATLIAVIAGFFLLTTGDVQELTLGPLKFDDISPILKLAPAVMAFVYLDLIMLYLVAFDYDRLYQELVRKLWLPVLEADLELALAPKLGSLWGGRNIIASGRPTHSTVVKVNDFLLGISGVLMLLFPLVFVAYAFVVLFDRFGAGDPLIWLAVAAATLCLVRALIALAYWNTSAAK